MKKVVILTIGNELLNGLVTDTNSSWLCKQFSLLGANVRRVIILPDDVEIIARDIRENLSAPDVAAIVTVGGLGPTLDDATLTAVALALDRPLELHDNGLAILTRRYRELHARGHLESADIDSARRKMAMLPRGAVALDQNTGTAPGALIYTADRQIIVSLPGVPAEMKDIFTGSLQPHLEKVIGDGVFVERVLTTDCNDESRLAAMLADVARERDRVYIKSRAEEFDHRVQMQIVIVAAGPKKAAVMTDITQAAQDVIERLSAADISVLSDELRT
jgi:nicotinamide-nucleotide amidase